ncbi:MAG: DUF4270 domain-containing protein [Prevotella sp.]|uniref:DUF4270 domain-containing protein n=1 Tax=Prevotella sp. TaxID=59823 RepID=UPI00258DE0BA|nr:DUF4270 domain-containing protein [Prevotella sp.]MDD6853501.1 DUF4270 domain-containing protein [Prevotella sp.]
MKSKQLILFVAALALLFTACDDTTDNIGSSLTPSSDRINVVADTFSVTSRTILADSIMARNTTGYLGRIKDPETGDVVKAGFMTQFHTLEGYKLPDESQIVSRDANGNVIADSCELELTFDNYYGDSLAQMKMRAYLMDSPMEEGVNYSTNYDPLKAGKISANGLRQDRTYTLADMTVTDSARSVKNYVKNIRIKLNKPFTKDGVTYNNYGTYIMRTFYAHPELFSSNYKFIHNVIPGFYFENTGGLGSMAYINTPLIFYYFRYNVTTDSTIVASSSFAGTEEVLQTTTFSTDRDKLKELAADNSCTYLKTPEGLYTEVSLPVAEIMSGHENDTVNTARLNIPRIVNQNPSAYSLSLPSTVLMIPADSLYSFFANHQLPDYKTSYIATYSTKTNSYLFGNISGMVNAMYRNRMAGNTSEKWNKVVLVPVTLETTKTSSNTTTLVNLSSDMSLSSTRLLGGTDNPDALKITVVYSSFKH